MKVILTKDIPNLGLAGQVRVVSDGYARNFLIPQGLALFATPGNIKQFEAQRKESEVREIRSKAQAHQIAEQLSELTLTFKAKVGESDKLYGSITAADIAEQIQVATGREIDKRRLDLEHSIRELGTHEVAVKLAPGITGRVKVIVERAE
jgi:large subunit ribosomal protein L9